MYTSLYGNFFSQAYRLFSNTLSYIFAHGPFTSTDDNPYLRHVLRLFYPFFKNIFLYSNPGQEIQGAVSQPEMMMNWGYTQVPFSSGHPVTSHHIHQRSGRTKGTSPFTLLVRPI